MYYRGAKLYFQNGSIPIKTAGKPVKEGRTRKVRTNLFQNGFLIFDSIIPFSAWALFGVIPQQNSISIPLQR